MRHIDLCSGIGGFALAAHWAGYKTEVFCERDEFCQKVLRKHWQSVPIISDLFDFDGRPYAGADLLTAGIPCQPYSCAGKRLGDDDDRALWPEARRIIAEVRPRYVLLENVAGFINLALDGVLADLEAQGYETWAVVLPACAVNAPHRRDRVWVVAHRTGEFGDERLYGIGNQSDAESRDGRKTGTARKAVADADETGRSEQRRTLATSPEQPAAECRRPCQFCGYEFDHERLGKYGCPNCCGEGLDDGQFEPPVCRILDGVSNGLDKDGLRHDIMGYSDLVEYSNAKTEIARPDQVLCGLRETTFQETLWDKFRGQDSVRQKEVLRPALYGGRNDAGSTDAGGIAKEGGGISRPELPRMQNDRETSGSPYRHESGEQRTIEHHDVVRCVSCLMALEAWESSRINMLEAITLRRLRQGISEIMAGDVPETLSEVQEIWRSLDDETMEWLMLRVSTGDPFCKERPAIPRVATGIPQRAARLKAIGNAIVPQVAYQIISRLPKEAQP